jgi:quinoprotein glucose dehydrogenase
VADIRNNGKPSSGIAAALLLGLGVSFGVAAADWPEYGGDAGGRRYSTAAQVTPANVRSLEQAWTFRTGELGENLARRDKLTFEATPILVGRTLYFSTATAIVHAIDAITGRPVWRHDAAIDRRLRYSEVASRGVTYWRNPAARRGPCAARVFLGTIDGRLIALDASDGKPCVGFGTRGSIDLTRGVRLRSRPEYGVTSPPVVIDGLVVVGSAIGDNRATNLELGVVRAFDAVTGALRWHWDPIPRDAIVPRDAANPLFTEVDEQAAQWTGAANAWAPLSVDRERGLVFVPTGSASPDFYGGQRSGDNRWANSIVALRAATGELVWGQQLVRHDLWDYDVASQPTLAELVRDGVRVPVVIGTAKTGMVFVFRRDDGAPVFPVVERRVPASDVPGETPSSTQPFASLPPLVPHSAVTPQDAWGLTPWDRGQCREQISRLRSEGIFTPPSLQGSILRPAYTGGPNWGGLSFDPERQYVIAPVMDLAAVVTLGNRERLSGMARSGDFGASEFAQMLGTPFGMRRELLLSPLGVPCTAPPWGKLVALDLARGRIAWSVPLGTTRDSAPFPLWWIKGVPALGGAIVTRSGLVFVGAATDDYLRAFDVGTGEELWKGRLPGGGQATPMTYELGGRQFVVIAAGGHAGAGTTPGDTLVAFSLPPR